MLKQGYRGRILVLSGILLVALTLRTAVTVVPPLVSTINSDIPFNAATIGLLGMLPTAAFGVFGFLTPYVIRWASLERLIVLAMAVAVVGQLVRVFVPSTALFLLFSVLALAGMGAGNVLLPPLVKKYFPDRVGLLTALYVTLISVGTALPAQLAVPVADAAGWRWSLGWWAGVNVVAAIPWLATMINSRTRSSPGSPTTATAVPTAARLNPWRSLMALGLAFMFGCTSLNTYAMFAWLPQILTDAGLDRSAAGSMLALFAGVGLPLSLLVPLFAGRMANPFPMIVVFLACFIAGYLGLLLAPAALTWLWVSLAGLGPGTFPLALLLINLRTRTHAAAGALSGFSQGVGYSVACLGPLLFGILHESTGSWLTSFLFLFASLAVLVTGGFIISKPRFIEDEYATAPR
ncbi:MAG TPA: MFS transporter [Micrococcaceae bacterium]|nr:MFS transporter [Micrococcaceae bacterium]